MPIHLRQNQYRGVNAHLHSVLQNTPAGWEEFHGLHTTDIVRFIDAQLPSRYRASYERSFQYTLLSLQRFGGLEERLAKPDAMIYQQNPTASGTTPASTATMPTLTYRVEDLFDDPEDYLRAVAVRALDKTEPEDIVAWIELLSPSNKPPSSGFGAYYAKRSAAVIQGIITVEIDYLHQSPPVISRLRRYPQENSYPYYIALTVPRPAFPDGQVAIYGFAVDDLLPQVHIPLLDDDSVTVDFGMIYNQTFQSLRRFSDLVDYSEEPPRLETYSPADQERIRARMAAVAKAHTPTP
jgi:hypothetical protein